MARIDHHRSADAPAANSIVVAVTAFVQDESGRLLLIRRTDNDLYAIPGGALELGETLTQTVQREVMEETGIAVEVTSLIGIYSNPDHVIEFTDGEVRLEFSICFRAVPTSGDLRTSGESKEVLWVAPSNGRAEYPPVHPLTHPPRPRRPRRAVLLVGGPADCNLSPACTPTPSTGQHYKLLTPSSTIEVVVNDRIATI